jgi:hypothetical protein
MTTDETGRRKQHDDDLAYARLDEGDPDLGLDSMSTLLSVQRLANNVADLGALIAQRLRERMAKRRAKGAQ